MSRYVAFPRLKRVAWSQQVTLLFKFETCQVEDARIVYLALLREALLRPGVRVPAALLHN